MIAGLLRRSWLDAVAVLAVSGILVVTLWPDIEARARAFRVQPAARRELLAFTSALTLETSRADVVSRVSQGGRLHLNIADVHSDLVLVETPYTFGAGNWVAWLDFTKGRLSSVRIRTADGVSIKPVGSPPDVGVAPPR